MKDIDFLPAEIVRQRVRHTEGRCRLLIALLVVVLMAGSSAHQSLRRRQVARQIEALTPAYQAARQQQRQLKQFRVTSARLEETAALCTFLEHPWPRSQILAHLLLQVPSSIRLTTVRVSADPSAPRAARAASSTQLAAPETVEADAADAARRDFEALREQVAERPGVMEIIGTTTDAAALHTLLNQLCKSPLLASARLVSLAAANEDRDQLRFTVRVELSRAYGLPGGPSPATTRLAQRPEGNLP